MKTYKLDRTFDGRFYLSDLSDSKSNTKYFGEDETIHIALNYIKMNLKDRDQVIMGMNIIRHIIWE